MKYLLIMTLLIFTSCKYTPDGYDNKGAYVLRDSCVNIKKTYIQTMVYTGKVFVPTTVVRSKCTESIVVKKHLKPSQIKQ